MNRTVAEGNAGNAAQPELPRGYMIIGFVTQVQIFDNYRTSASENIQWNALTGLKTRPVQRMFIIVSRAPEAHPPL